MCVPKAPDWLAMPMRPAIGQPFSNEEEKVGKKPHRALNRPRQFGPSSRMPCARAPSAMRACSAAPSAPVSAKPELNTIAAPTPARPSSSTVALAASAGTATTATSGTRGRSATEA